jgi:hypothetical protein
MFSPAARESFDVCRKDGKTAGIPGRKRYAVPDGKTAPDGPPQEARRCRLIGSSTEAVRKRRSASTTFRFRSRVGRVSWPRAIKSLTRIHGVEVGGQATSGRGESRMERRAARGSVWR